MVFHTTASKDLLAFISVYGWTCGLERGENGQAVGGLDTDLMNADAAQSISMRVKASRLCEIYRPPKTKHKPMFLSRRNQDGFDKGGGYEANHVHMTQRYKK